MRVILPSRWALQMAIGQARSQAIAHDLLEFWITIVAQDRKDQILPLQRMVLKYAALVLIMPVIAASCSERMPPNCSYSELLINATKQSYPDYVPTGDIEIGMLEGRLVGYFRQPDGFTGGSPTAYFSKTECKIEAFVRTQ